MYVHIEANNFKFGTAQCSVVYRWIAGLKVGRWQEGLGTLNFRDIILPRLIACIVLPPLLLGLPLPSLPATLPGTSSPEKSPEGRLIIEILRNRAFERIIQGPKSSFRSTRVLEAT